MSVLDRIHEKEEKTRNTNKGNFDSIIRVTILMMAKTIENDNFLSIFGFKEDQICVKLQITPEIAIV